MLTLGHSFSDDSLLSSHDGAHLAGQCQLTHPGHHTFTPSFCFLSVHWLQESSGGNPKTDSVHTKPCRKEEFQMCSKQNSQKHRGSSAITS